MRCTFFPLLLLSLSLSLLACDSGSGGHSHESAHPGGHNHHEEGHGHGEVPTQSQTLWSDNYEVFAEHSPGLVGGTTEFLLHFTDLRHFRALTEATVSIQLEGASQGINASTSKQHPGIYQASLPADKAGRFSGVISIQPQGQEPSEVNGLQFEVFTDAKTANGSVKEADHQGLIEFLKEQQWGVPFMTQFAKASSLVRSVEVAGRIDTPPGGRAEVSAALAGRLIAPPEGLARPGSQVSKGTILARLMPTFSSPEAAARASLVVAEAQARSSAANANLARAKRLIAQEAIPQRELEDALREEKVAAESVRAARRAAQLYSGARRSGNAHPLIAPIDGVIVSVHGNPGGTVAPGDVVFEIINTDELWIVAQVPEQDAAQLRTGQNASFQVSGSATWTPIDIQSANGNASLVTVAPTVDPRSRTVEVLYSLKQPGPHLRVGGLVQVSLPAGENFSGIVIPETALVNQEGRNLVYVQIDGEHFQERLVRIGPRAGGNIAIVSGLNAGERIVTVGAHLVRLADRANSSAPAHGHVH